MSCLSLSLLSYIIIFFAVLRLFHVETLSVIIFMSLSPTLSHCLNLSILYPMLFPYTFNLTWTIKIFQRSVETPSGRYVVQDRESHQQVSSFLLCHHPHSCLIQFPFFICLSYHHAINLLIFFINSLFLTFTLIHPYYIFRVEFCIKNELNTNPISFFLH